MKDKKEPESLQEILREMRMGDTGPFKFAYRIGRPDKIVDCKFYKKPARKMPNL